MVRGALEGHLEAKLEAKMASKCVLAAQLGVQVRLGSPTWRPSAPWQSNLAVQGDFFLAQLRIPRKIGVHRRAYDRESPRGDLESGGTQSPNRPKKKEKKRNKKKRKEEKI